MRRTNPRLELDWRAHSLAAAALFVLPGCGDDAPDTALVVAPAFGDPCRAVRCENEGSCVENRATSEPMCLCPSAFAGERCEECAPGYHRDSRNRCVPDERCADQPDDPCGVHGMCTDDDGVIACACDLGYEGARCELCRPGFARDEFGECLQRVLSDGKPVTLPATCSEDTCHNHGQCSDLDGMVECSCYSAYEGSRCEICAPGYSPLGGSGRCVANATCGQSGCGTCATFEDVPDGPVHPDTCASRTELQLDGMLLWSMGGDGTVWLCAESTLYGLEGAHTVLEAGAVLPAEITFLQPVAAVSFDYAAPDPFALELVADGDVVQTLSAELHAADSLMLSFDPPISVLGFRSTDEFAQSIAIDNLLFEPALCQ